MTELPWIIVSWFDRIRPRINRLHWRMASERITYNVTVLEYKTSTC